MLGVLGTATVAKDPNDTLKWALVSAVLSLRVRKEYLYRDLITELLKRISYYMQGIKSG